VKNDAIYSILTLKQFYFKKGRRFWPKNYYHFWKYIDAELDLD